MLGFEKYNLLLIHYQYRRQDHSMQTHGKFAANTQQIRYKHAANLLQTVTER
jgi:hypothetical protein